MSLLIYWYRIHIPPITITKQCTMELYDITDSSYCNMITKPLPRMLCLFSLVEKRNCFTKMLTQIYYKSRTVDVIRSIQICFLCKLKLCQLISIEILCLSYLVGNCRTRLQFKFTRNINIFVESRYLVAPYAFTRLTPIWHRTCAKSQ